MKRFVLIIFLLMPNCAVANDVQLSALLNICGIAQKNADKGTVRNIANQLKDKVRPDDLIKSKQFDACLQAAFGEVKTPEDLNELLARISESAKQLKDDCHVLLKIMPEVAISHPTCKALLFD
tara:strand:+ start:10 stop:378 length:369 start_codon:yes stop_codon:yes gene_type:complete